MFGKNGKMRAQAAMEYLMTYGWALLVIVIVIAILLIINPFSAPQGCRFDNLGFSCSNPVVDTSGNLFVRITNNQNNAIGIIELGCTYDKNPEPRNMQSFSVVVPRQGYQDVIGQISCETSAPLAPGQEFSGKIWMSYVNEEDPPGYPVHVASASFVTKAGQ